MKKYHLFSGASYADKAYYDSFETIELAKVKFKEDGFADVGDIYETQLDGSLKLKLTYGTYWNQGKGNMAEWRAG